MATPTITFSNASGSDIAASGAGPATALSGTSASFTGSVVTLDGSPDLSGVATDGSHVLWLQTTTGRQFFTINAVDDGADTVTLDDAPAGTATGLTWGIGGKRKTLDNADSRLLFSADLKEGWIVELEDDQSLSSGALVINCNTTGSHFVFRSDTPGVERIITQTTDATALDFDTTNGNAVYIIDIAVENTAGTKTAAIGMELGSSAGSAPRVYILLRCRLGHPTNTLYRGITAGGGNKCIYLTILCEIQHCTDTGYVASSNSAIDVMSSIHDNGGVGVTVSNDMACFILQHVYRNGSSNWNTEPDSNGCQFAFGCINDDAGADGWAFDTGSGGGAACIGLFNVFSNAAIHGVDPEAVFASFSNAFYNNTTNDIDAASTLLIEEDSQALSVDPYVNAASDDYNLNGTANAGAVLRAITKTLGGTTVHPFRQWVSDQFSTDVISGIAGIGVYDRDVVTNPVSSVVGLSLSASGWKVGASCIAPRAFDLTSVYVYKNSITGTSPTYQVSIQGVDANGMPDGVSVETKTFTPTITGWEEIVLTTPVSLALKEQYAIVVEYSSGTINGSNFCNFGVRQSSSSVDMPHALQNTGSWARLNYHSALYPVDENGVIAGNAIGANAMTPASSTSIYFNTSDTYYEYGNKISMPFTGTVVGIVAQIRLNNVSSTGTICVYDAADTLIDSLNIDTSHVVQNTGFINVFLPLAAHNVTAGDVMRYTLKATSGSGFYVGVSQILLENAEDESCLTGRSAGSVNLTYRAAGAWTDEASKLIKMIPWYSTVNAPAAINAPATRMLLS